MYQIYPGGSNSAPTPWAETNQMFMTRILMSLMSECVLSWYGSAQATQAFFFFDVCVHRFQYTSLCLPHLSHFGLVQSPFGSNWFKENDRNGTLCRRGWLYSKIQSQFVVQVTHTLSLPVTKSDKGSADMSLPSNLIKYCPLLIFIFYTFNLYQCGLKT